MVYLLIYFALFAIWITAELLLAPKGFEDGEGFHYGNPESDKRKIFSSKKNLKKVLTEKKRKISLQP